MFLWREEGMPIVLALFELATATDVSSFQGFCSLFTFIKKRRILKGRTPIFLWYRLCIRRRELSAACILVWSRERVGSIIHNASIMLSVSLVSSTCRWVFPFNAARILWPLNLTDQVEHSHVILPHSLSSFCFCFSILFDDYLIIKDSYIF